MPFKKNSIPWNKGKHHSEETKRKISKSNQGKKKSPFSEEHKKKISDIRRGKCHTEKTKTKIREALLRRKEKLGYINSPETRQKMSESRRN